MNIKSFLSKIWNNIRSLFDKFPLKLKVAVHTGIVITENIKRFVDSPLADVLTAIIPGELDDKVKLMLRQQLPVILVNLNLTEACHERNEPEQITICAIKKIQALNGDTKNAYLHNISVMIAQIAADGRLSWSDGVCLLEWYYQNKYKAVV